MRYGNESDTNETYCYVRIEPLLNIYYDTRAILSIKNDPYTVETFLAFMKYLKIVMEIYKLKVHIWRFLVVLNGQIRKIRCVIYIMVVL